MSHGPSRFALALVLAGTFLVFAGPTASAYPRPGRTVHVSVASTGGHGDDNSYAPSISADGRFVAFISAASNLVPGDTNGVRDIFVHDRKKERTERVSISSSGAQANASAFAPSISADGRYVAFDSAASSLVPGNTNGRSDVFVHDRETGTTRLVSVDANGAQVSGTSASPSISADGRFVAFHSDAPGLVSGDTNQTYDIFVKDLQSEAVERVSVASDGGEGNAPSQSPAISADGSVVAFGSEASTLVPGDTNGTRDVFVHDRASGDTTLVSVSSAGAQGENASERAAISGDGRFVGFHSVASNFVPSDTNVNWDVFVHDRADGTTERISVGSHGQEGDASSINASLSFDGRHVAFASFSTNLVPGDDDTHAWDAYLHDRATGSTERISVGDEGQRAGDGLTYPSVSVPENTISADGRYAAFWTASDALVPGGLAGAWKVFVRDRGPKVGVGELSTAPLGNDLSVTGWVTFSGAVISSAQDGDSGGLPGAVGADLANASVTYRPEAEDLLLRLGVASMPTPPPPGIVWGLTFHLNDVRYEVRAMAAAATTVPPSVPSFGLYRCEADCSAQAPLSGSVGSTGREILVSLPLSALDLDEGDTLGELTGFAALGEAAPGPLIVLDEIDLPEATIPTAGVWLALAPAYEPEEEVAFDTKASMAQGRFAAMLDAASPGPPGRRLWARACLGAACSSTSMPVEPG